MNQVHLQITSPPTKDTVIRQLGPVRAALSNFLGIGLGYVYVGRIELAFAFVATLIGITAIAGWSRLIFHPLGLYALAAVTTLATVFVVTHSGLIAARNRTAIARPYTRWWFYILWIVLSLFLSQWLLSSRSVLFGFEPFRIPSSSMAPAVQKGDFVMADTWYFDRTDPQYGDLIVFRVPGDTDVKFLKRIVGLPGDKIEIRDDVLIRNGQPINEPYIQLTDQGPERSRNFEPAIMSDENYFVLGDNRHRAKDSRYIGPIDQSLLHGRVVHRWFAYRDSVLWDRFPEMLDNNRE